MMKTFTPIMLFVAMCLQSMVVADAAKKITAHASAFRHGIRVEAEGDPCDKYGAKEGDTDTHKVDAYMCEPGDGATQTLCCCGSDGKIKKCGKASVAECQVDPKTSPPTDNAHADGDTNPKQDLTCKDGYDQAPSASPSSAEVENTGQNAGKVYCASIGDNAKAWCDNKDHGLIDAAAETECANNPCTEADAVICCKVMCASITESTAITAMCAEEGAIGLVEAKANTPCKNRPCTKEADAKTCCKPKASTANESTSNEGSADVSSATVNESSSDDSAVAVQVCPADKLVSSVKPDGKKACCAKMLSDCPAPPSGADTGQWVSNPDQAKFPCGKKCGTPPLIAEPVCCVPAVTIVQ